MARRGPFAEVSKFAEVVLESGCKKSQQFLNAHFDLCVLAALLRAMPSGSLVKLRPELVWKTAEELAAAAGRDGDRVRHSVLKKAGEILAALKRELGERTTPEAALAKLAELFLRELEA